MGTEKTLGWLWEREEYSNLCSKEDLWAAVAENEAKTPLQMKVRGEEHRKEGFQRRFWDKQPDGMVLDKEAKVCYVLELKWALERFAGAQEQTVIKSGTTA